MGERIEGGAMPPPQTGKRPKRNKYPWDKWFDGSVWSLTRGQDFQVSLNAFRGAASQAAKREGIRITTRKVAEGTILLQAIRESSEGSLDEPVKAKPVKADRPRGISRLWRK